MIAGILLRLLPNNRYAAFLKNVLEVLVRFDVPALQVAADHLALANAVQELQLLLNKSRGNSITKELKRLDQQRDDAMTGMLFIIKGNVYSSNPVIKMQATLLEERLAPFGPGLRRQSYQNATNRYTNLITAWTSDTALTTALTALGLDYWRADIETANREFDKRYIDRSVHRGLNQTENVRAKRMAINQLYYELRNALQAQYIVRRKTEPEPFYSAILAWNALIEDYKKL